MAHHFSLKIKGKTYDIQQYDFCFSRGVTPLREPATDLRGGQITMEVQGADAYSVLEAAKKQDEGMDIELLIHDPKDDQKVLRTVKGKTCYLTDVLIHVSGGAGLRINYIFSAGEFSNGDVVHVKPWKTNKAGAGS